VNHVNDSKSKAEPEDWISIWLLFLAVVVFIYAPALYPNLLHDRFMWSMQVFLLGMGNGIWLALLVSVTILRIRLADLLELVPRIVPFKIEPWPKFFLYVFTQLLGMFNFLSHTPSLKSYKAMVIMSVVWFFTPFGVMRLYKNRPKVTPSRPSDQQGHTKSVGNRPMTEADDDEKPIVDDNDRSFEWIVFVVAYVVAVLPTLYPKTLDNLVIQVGLVLYLMAESGWWLATIAILALRKRSFLDILRGSPRRTPFRIGVWPQLAISAFPFCLCWYNLMFCTSHHPSIWALIFLSVVFGLFWITSWHRMGYLAKR
jgi:hypothetical protein